MQADINQLNSLFTLARLTRFARIVSDNKILTFKYLCRVIRVITHSY